MLELKALVACAPNFAGAKAYDRAAIVYSRSGELAAQLNRSKQAPQLLREAFENYRLSDDRQGMNATWKRLKELGENVSDLTPLLRWQIPWPWVRLALELAILAVAAALFYLTLR